MPKLHGMKVQDAYTPFIEYGLAERGYAPETIKKLQDCFAAWLLPHLGEKEVEAVSPWDVLQLKSKMVQKNIGAYRQYSVIMALKGFFKFTRQILKLKALDPNEIRLPKRPKPQVQYLTREELQIVLNAINRRTFTGLRLYTLMMVLASTGLRISEALALDRHPFEMNEKQIEIVGKGKKRRTVFFPEECLVAVKRYLYRRDDDHSALVKTTGIPRRLSRTDIWRFFKQLRAKTGLNKPLTPHILRHTYCTLLLHSGADITYIKELVGHSDIQTTAKYYLGVDKKTLRGVVDKHLDLGLGEAA